MVSDVEVWRDIAGYEGLYQVSSHGRVKSFHYGDGRLLKGRISQNGYVRLTLSLSSTTKGHVVHRLVAAAFLGTLPAGYQVNHIDGNKTNNHVLNLEYVTPKENTAHACELGLRRTGSRMTQAKITEVDVVQIYGMGKIGIDRGVIASIYGLTRSSIDCILNGKLWKSVTSQLEIITELPRPYSEGGPPVSLSDHAAQLGYKSSTSIIRRLRKFNGDTELAFRPKPLPACTGYGIRDTKKGWAKRLGYSETSFARLLQRMGTIESVPIKSGWVPPHQSITTDNRLTSFSKAPHNGTP